MHLHRLIGVAMLAGVFVIMLGPSGVWAASQAGGLPAVSDRLSVLEGIVATLRTAVTTQQTQITALQTANTGLQNALSAETAARIAADTALQAALDKEAEKRLDNDLLLLDTLSKRIAAKAQSFIAGEFRVFIPNGQRTTVAQLPLPAGSFFVMAKAIVTNQDHDASWICRLDRSDAAEDRFLDLTEVNTESFGEFNPNALIHNNVVLATVTTLGAPATIRMDCETIRDEPGSVVDEIVIVAISVGR